MSDPHASPTPSQTPPPATTGAAESPTGPTTPLSLRDTSWAASHPWHPRALPFFIYIAFLILYPLREWQGWIYPVIYTAQCGITALLLWRYRRLLPELTLTFHWLAVPVGIGVAAAWLGLGLLIRGMPTADMSDPGWVFFDEIHPISLAWASFFMRLLGMAILVPLVEELFIRSLLLRSLSDPRKTGIGLVQVLNDMPIVGDWLIDTRLGERAHDHPPVFGPEFERNALGTLTIFGVLASTLLFTINHQPADWPGAIVCGIAYCLLLAATRRHGLGPVIWAHGITNALLWGYTLYTHYAGYPDWRFL